MPTNGFAQLVESAQHGDVESLETLLTEYGNAIRREVRFCLRDSRLRQVVGESDIYQSVVTRFALHLRVGEYRFVRPGDMVNLLKTMARAHVAQLTRFWQAQRRDVRRNEILGSDAAEEHAATPSSVMGLAELIEQALRRLSERDRQIVQWRQDAIGWSEIATRLGEPNADSVRKRHQRSLDRIAQEVGGDS